MSDIESRSIIKQEIQVPRVIPVLDTAAYTAADVLFATVPVPG